MLPSWEHSVLTSVRSYPAPTPRQPCLWFCNNKCCLPLVGLCLPSPPTLPSSDSGPGRPGETNGGNGTIPFSVCSPAFPVCYRIGDWCFFLLSGDTFGSWTGRLAVTPLWAAGFSAEDVALWTSRVKPLAFCSHGAQLSNISLTLPAR